MIKDYMTKDQVYDELENLRDEIKEEIEEELTPMFEDMATEIAEENVATCESSLLTAFSSSTQ